MGTLGGFPNPPALWLWRAKPAFAYAIMGALGRVPKPSRDGTPPARARAARGGQGGLSVPKAGGLPTRLSETQARAER